MMKLVAARVTTLLTIFYLAYIIYKNPGYSYTQSSNFVGSHVNQLEKQKQVNDTLPRNMKRLVLILSNARSGSSWLGDMMKQGDNSYYMFEPFIHLLKEGYYTQDFICFNNNTCRKPNLPMESHEFALEQLHNLFTCKFDMLPDSILRNLGQFIIRTEVQPFQTCERLNSIRTCLNMLKDTCKRSEVIVIKTIRLTMQLVQTLKESLPQLKVLHLIRDPRAITYSRRKGPFGMSRMIEPHSLDMCNRLVGDVLLSRNFKRLYPDSYALTIYEQLAENPLKVLEDIYTYVGMTLTPAVKRWVHKSTHTPKGESYFGTARGDPVKTAYSWRRFIDIHTVRIVDNMCKRLYGELGYKQVTSLDELRNMNITLHRKLSFDLADP